MKEPYWISASGAHIPFSQCEVGLLKQVALSSPLAFYTPGEDGETDVGFDRQYAAILLRERGQ